MRVISYIGDCSLALRVSPPINIHISTYRNQIYKYRLTTSQVKSNRVKKSSKMSNNQVKIHQDQEDKLPFNGENGNSFLRDQDELIGQHEQVSKEKTRSKIPRKLHHPASLPRPSLFYSREFSYIIKSNIYKNKNLVIRKKYKTTD